MNPNKTDFNDEIDIKEIFHTFFRYKWMIIIVVTIFGVASSYKAYFQPSIYRAASTVEVGLKQSGYRGDVINMAMNDAGVVNSDTEIGIIESRFLAKKAMKDVDFSHRYYMTKHLKEIELYTDAPFEVGMKKGFGISFELYGIDKKRYRLVVKNGKNSDGTTWSYDKVHMYGKEIITKHFHLNIVKRGSFAEEKYRFVILKENLPVGKVSARQTTKYSTILEISYEDNVARRAQAFANALAKAYIEQNIEKKTKEATLKLDFIDKQLKKITQNLKSSAVKIEEFKKGTNTVSLSSKAEVIIQQMSEADSKLEEISMQSELLNRLYNQIKQGKNLESISAVTLGESNEALANQIAMLQEAILQKKTLRQDYTELYPGVVKLTRKIRYLQKSIINTIKNLKDSMQEKKRLLEKTITKYQKNLNKLPADERMFGQLQRKFAVNEKIYSYLLEKRSETAIVKAATVSKNRVIDTALLPSSPIKPKRTMIVVVGLVLGLIVGILLAFLRNYLDDRIKSEEDVTHSTDLPLLGVIPHMREGNDTLKVMHSPKSAVAEAFRNLRTNLQFMVHKDKSHVLAVTSTIGGEGKTTVCTNLAAIMSMAEKKTIVLNLDMRKPTLHERFGLPNKYGMSTLLSGSTNLGNVIQKTEYEHLDVITSGPVPPNPSELIQNELMTKVIEKLREVYDVIILDTPPVGLVTDARTLMSFADTSIYVLRSGYSKKGFIQNLKMLSSIQEIHGLSIVINDAKLEKGGYGYGYGYGHGYGYYEEEK